MILIFHGSTDLTHNQQAIRLAEAVGAKCAFMEVEPRFRGGLGVPIFITDGADYRKALEIATVKAPPLVRWPGFIEYLKSLDADLYIFHGPDYGGIKDLPIALLYGEPNLRKAPCVKTAMPVVLTRGYIYRKIEAEYTSRCPASLLPPLAEQEPFVEYLKATIKTIVDTY
ncbi:MAG: hypothetical protein ACK4SY_00760 [Pyrobaculum sp.]